MAIKPMPVIPAFGIDLGPLAWSGGYVAYVVNPSFYAMLEGVGLRRITEPWELLPERAPLGPQAPAEAAGAETSSFENALYCR